MNFKAMITLFGLLSVCSAQLQGFIPLGQPAAVPIPAAPVPQVQPLLRRPVTPLQDERPEPFAFGFNSLDEFGTTLTRQEEGDASGVVRGSYSYRDATGLFRTVNYIADDNGFRASVDSNEPGLISHNPADVTYRVNNQPPAAAAPTLRAPLK